MTTNPQGQITMKKRSHIPKTKSHILSQMSYIRINIFQNNIWNDIHNHFYVFSLYSTLWPCTRGAARRGSMGQQHCSDPPLC